MTSGAYISTVYTVLGFLDEYLGRHIVRDGDLVEHFYVNEKNVARIFEYYLQKLINETQLQTTLRKDEEDEHTYFYSNEVTQLIDSYYLNHGLIDASVDEILMYTEGKSTFSRLTGYISYTIFPPNENDLRIAFLAGAYYRYGEQNSFTLVNALHKVRLIKRLLLEVGSPHVVIIHPEPGDVPSTFRIGFEPTSELNDRFNLNMSHYF